MRDCGLWIEVDFDKVKIAARFPVLQLG